jgi:surface polysaccharide O-acyltransferase-like enzyme
MKIKFLKIKVRWKPIWFSFCLIDGVLIIGSVITGSTILTTPLFVMLVGFFIFFITTNNKSEK